MIFSRIAILVLMLLPTGHANAGLIFNITSTGDPNADAGFATAADFWSSRFNDSITINIDAAFKALGSGVLGSAGSTRMSTSYSNFRNAVQADISTASDATFAAGLPTGSSYSVYINRTLDNPNGANSATPYVDSTGANTSTVRMTTANAKALGLFSGTGVDAEISFSNSFSFDFDPSDGIDSGKYDFVGIAIHELGHAMGFISGVDVLDGNSPDSAGDFFNDDEFTYVNSLDFARFSDASEAAGADIDWTADARDKYFSIDGGLSKAAAGNSHWSTGLNHGDGRQASHWKDGNLGIMDPTSRPPGTANVVTDLDLLAFDVIGWNRISAVPEPSSATLVAISLISFCMVRRRQFAR